MNSKDAMKLVEGLSKQVLELEMQLAMVQTRENARLKKEGGIPVFAVDVNYTSLNPGLSPAIVQPIADGLQEFMNKHRIQKIEANMNPYKIIG